MRSPLYFVLLAAFALVLTGCGAPAGNNAANTTPANTEPTKTPADVVKNDAPTLAPVFKAYCEAWVKNDEAALRKVYSSETLKQFEAEMKAEGQKSLLKSLEATDKVSGDPCEIVNEEITGDKATARIRTNKYPQGITAVFVKENNEWKLTNRVPDIGRPQQP